MGPERDELEVPVQRIDRTPGLVEQEFEIQANHQYPACQQRQRVRCRAPSQNPSHHETGSEEPGLDPCHRRQSPGDPGPEASLRSQPDAEQNEGDRDWLDHSGVVVEHACRRERRKGTCRDRHGHPPIPVAKHEDQHHSQRAEGQTEEPRHNDVNRTGGEEQQVHQKRMERPPDVLISPHVPKAGSVRETDLFGQIGNLPVVVGIGEPLAGVLRVGEREEVDESRNNSAGCDQDDPSETHRRWLGFPRPFGGRVGSVDAAIFLLLVDQDPRHEPQAVAASAATCSCERATSRIERSSLSRCRSQSKRRAHSKARSPVVWLVAGSSSMDAIPPA